MYLFLPLYILYINTPGAPKSTKNYYPGFATLAAYLIIKCLISINLIKNEIIITIRTAYETKKRIIVE